MAALDRPARLNPSGMGPDWGRRVSTAVNWLLGQQIPFERLSAAPASPVEGQGYYDTVTHKARVYDGTAWQDLW